MRWTLGGISRISLLSFLLLGAACSNKAVVVDNANQVVSESTPTNQGTTDTTVVTDKPCSGTPTPQQGEGPYYKANSPRRTNLLEKGTGGTPLTISGRVFDVNCQPVAGAWLDFWQADENGAYDNTGFNLRGHQFTDDQGQYLLETIIPKQYPGRPQHIHVKVRKPDGTMITSQLFLELSDQGTGETINPLMVLDVKTVDAEQQAIHHFVL